MIMTTWLSFHTLGAAIDYPVPLSLRAVFPIGLDVIFSLARHILLLI